MTLTDITTIVQEYANEGGENVDQYVMDTINDISSIFPIYSIDSDVTVAGDDYLALPERTIQIHRVKIGDTEIEKTKIENIEHCERLGLCRWYIADGLIMLTKPMTTDNEVIKIYLLRGYVIPTLEDDTDVPTDLMELVYLGAAFRLMKKLVKAFIATCVLDGVNPDTKAVDLIANRDRIEQEYNSLLLQKKLSLRYDNPF